MNSAKCSKKKIFIIIDKSGQLDVSTPIEFLINKIPEWWSLWIPKYYNLNSIYFGCLRVYALNLRRLWNDRNIMTNLQISMLHIF